MSAPTRDDPAPAPITTAALDAWRSIARLPILARVVLVTLAFEECSHRLTPAHWAALVGVGEVELASALDALAEYRLVTLDHADDGLAIALRGPAHELARGLRTLPSASASVPAGTALFPCAAAPPRTGMSITPSPETAFLMRERARQARYRQRVKARRAEEKSAAESASQRFGSASERRGARSSPLFSSSSGALASTTTTTQSTARRGGGGGEAREAIGGDEQAKSRQALREAGVSSAPTRAELAKRVPFAAVREEIARTRKSGGGAGAIVENLRGYDPAEHAAPRVDAAELAERERAAAWQKRMSERVHELRVKARTDPEGFAALLASYSAATNKRHRSAESAILDPGFVAFTIRGNEA